MALQVVLLGESLVAQVALIGPVPSVQVHVVLEVVAMQEAGWAVWARVGTFSCVLPHVNLQLIIPSTSRGKGRYSGCRRGSQAHLSHTPRPDPLLFLTAVPPLLPWESLFDWPLAQWALAP